MSLLSKDLNITINNLKYQGEQIGPKISQNLINIKIMESKYSTLLIYLKNINLVVKLINDNNIIEEKDKIEIGKYHIYEIE